MEWTKENTAALGRLSSGLFIVTARQDDRADGFLASWIQQASFSPLMVSMAVKPGRPCYDYIQAHGRFCINIVGKDNGGVMKPFWSGYAPDTDPFAGLPHRLSEQGNLILENCLAAIECQVKDTVSAGDHQIVLAEVTGCHLLNEEDKPLTHSRKTGLDY